MAWLPDSSRSAALRYDTQAGPIMRPIAKALVQEAAIKAGDTVLDLLCEVGYAAREAAVQAGPLGAVTGLDSEQSLLDIARTHGAGYAIEWIRSECDELPLPSASVDIVLNQHSVAGVSDRRTCLKEALRVVEPSGRFLATVWGSIEDCPYLAAQARALTAVGAGTAVDSMRRRTSYGPAHYAGDLRHVGWREVRWAPISLPIRVPAAVNGLAEQLRALPWGGTLSQAQATQAARSLRDELATASGSAMSANSQPDRPSRPAEPAEPAQPAQPAEPAAPTPPPQIASSTQPSGLNAVGETEESLTTSLTIAVLRAYA